VLWHFAQKTNDKRYMIKSIAVALRRAMIFGPSTQVHQIKSIKSSPSTQVPAKQILRVS
jgi:hypothetical protein